MAAERVLIVEDHPDLLALCVEALERAGYDVVQATSGVMAEQVLRTSPLDLLLTDLKLPGPDGLELLKMAKEIDPDTGVILITGHPSVDTAVKALKAGAADYLVKPFSAAQLLGSVASTLEAGKAKAAYCRLRSQVRAFTVDGMVGRSRRMLELFDRIRRAAAVDSNVLVLGESGAGKERVARTIHDNSPRAGGPFVAINCAAIPETLLEAELFGWERGAFTGAQTAREGLLQTADRGSLFLDELCELHPLMQAKLLRAIEEGAVRRLGGRKPIPFDVRFIASTNRDILDEMRRERFRADIFFRLAVIELHVPALREHREDIPLLTAHFLQASSRRRSTRIEGFSEAALEALMTYDWPGNVRELRNVVERAAAFAQNALITPDELPDAVLASGTSGLVGTLRQWKQHALRRLERQYIKKALDEHGGNVSRTARALGVHRSTLQRFMRSA